MGASLPLKNFSPTLEKCVRHSFENLTPSQKTLRPSWFPKLVTGLGITLPIVNAFSAIANNIFSYLKRVIY